MSSESRVSAHYRVTGGRYFRYQVRGADLKGRLNARKFQPHVGPGEAIVDFGCGPGMTLAHLVAGDKVGIEVNIYNREFAAKHGIRTVESADELAAESADVVISNHALEHTLQPLTELFALRQILRPSGRLVIHLPVDDWRIERRPGRNDINRHLYGWTPLLLGNLLLEAGFKVIDCRVVNYGWPGRLTFPLARILSPSLFDAVAAFTAVGLKRRELRAIACRA